MRDGSVRVWAARLLIGLVFFFNVQCALAFLIAPQSFAPGFELSGDIGDGMVRGLGILFLMWNVPYAVALVHPMRRRVSLYEAIVMQAIGFTGETLLLRTLPGSHPVLQSSIGRFIAFDSAGFAALLLSAVLTRSLTNHPGY